MAFFFLRGTVDLWVRKEDRGGGVRIGGVREDGWEMARGGFKVFGRKGDAEEGKKR